MKNYTKKCMVVIAVTMGMSMTVFAEEATKEAKEGDAFGSDDWSSTVSMRGFSIKLNDQPLGITFEGMTNGGSKANRFLIGGARTAIFNVTVGL